MNIIGLILRKELTSALRDRRMLFATVIMPMLVLPLFTMLPMMMIGNREQQARETASRIAVSGIDYPELSEMLRADNRFRLGTADSVARDIRLGKLDAAIDVLSLPEGRKPAQVKVIFNATRTESRAALDKIKLAVSELSRRLVGLQIDTTTVNLNPVLIAPENVVSAKEMGGFFIGLLVGMMAIIGLINGTMIMAVDSTAGEKERRTLEVLLATPVNRNHIVSGKYLAAVTSGMFTVTLMTIGYAGAFTLGLRSLGKASEIGVFTVSWQVIPIILLIMLITAGFIAALQMAIGIFARSFREAQTYLAPLTILAVIPVVFMQTISNNPSTALFYVPLLNAMLLIRELLMGTIAPQHIMNTLVASLVCLFLALRFAFRMFNRETVLLR